MSQTRKKYPQQGYHALQWRKSSGTPTRLTTDQPHQQVDELNKGAQHHGFAVAVWTRTRVNEAIRKLFGVSYYPSKVGRLLKKVGWTRQKPQAKARRQDERAMGHWRQKRVQEIKTSAG